MKVLAITNESSDKTTNYHNITRIVKDVNGRYVLTFFNELNEQLDFIVYAILEITI